MTTYYIEQDNKIVLHDINKQRLVDTLLFMPQYKGIKILETEELIVDGVIMTQQEYENHKAQKERERLNMLFLTAADVERAIYKTKGLDFDDILELVKDNPNIDSKALKIELKANNFYRGNPYVSIIGQLLGFTEEQLDKFFETGDYQELM